MLTAKYGIFPIFIRLAHAVPRSTTGRVLRQSPLACLSLSPASLRPISRRFEAPARCVHCWSVSYPSAILLHPSASLPSSAECISQRRFWSICNPKLSLPASALPPLPCQSCSRHSGCHAQPETSPFTALGPLKPRSEFPGHHRMSP